MLHIGSALVAVTVIELLVGANVDISEKNVSGSDRSAYFIPAGLKIIENY